MRASLCSRGPVHRLLHCVGNMSKTCTAIYTLMVEPFHKLCLVKPLRIEKNRDGQKRNQSSTMLEDCREFTLSILMTKNTKKFSKMRDKIGKTNGTSHVFVKDLQKESRKCVRSLRFHPSRLQKRCMSVQWNLINPQDTELNLLSLITMKTTLQAKDLLQ